MRSMLAIGLVPLFVALAVAGVFTARAEQGESKLLRHVVLYKFKESVTPAQVQEVVDAFAALPKKVATIVDFERGTNISNEGKSDGLTHAFVVTFRDQKGLETYLAHSAHQEYVSIVKDRREKVIVLDYWTNE